MRRGDERHNDMQDRCWHQEINNDDDRRFLTELALKPTAIISSPEVIAPMLGMKAGVRR